MEYAIRMFFNTVAIVSICSMLFPLMVLITLTPVTTTVLWIGIGGLALFMALLVTVILLEGE